MSNEQLTRKRLNVLRSIITESNNAAKTSSPIRSDLQVLAMLKKRKNSSEAAQKEARDVKREDIAEKQQAEIDIIDEYAGSVQMMAEEDIKSAITGVVDQMKSVADTKAGQILKEIFKTGGVLDGKPVERSQVAKIVNDLLGGKS